MPPPKRTSSWFDRNRRNESRTRLVDELFDAMDRMTEVPHPPVMTPEEVADETRAMRQKKRSTE